MSVPETTDRQNRYLKSTQVSLSKGLLTIGAATILLFAVSALLDPASVSITSLSGMLPVAAVLAIAGLGQMLVVQQGGIDLSVAGGISLAIVIVTHIPDGDNGRLIPAILLAIALAVVAGVLNGVLIGGLGLNPIIATLGTNAVLYGVNLSISGGRPAHHDARCSGTSRAAPRRASRTRSSSPSPTLVVVAAVVKRTVSGRRFEAIGANFRAARAAGLRAQDLPIAVLRLGATAVLPGRHPDRGHHLAADRIRRRHLPAAVDRGRGPRRHLAAWWARLPAADRHRRGLPASSSSSW